MRVYVFYDAALRFFYVLCILQCGTYEKIEASVILLSIGGYTGGYIPTVFFLCSLPFSSLP